MMRIPYTPAEVEALVEGEVGAMRQLMREYIAEQLESEFYTDRPGGAFALHIDARIYAEISLELERRASLISCDRRRKAVG